MKIKIFGTLFLVSALIVGGGIDSGSMTQTLFGIVLGIIAGGVLIEKDQKNIKHFVSDNIHSYPCYFRK